MDKDQIAQQFAQALQKAQAQMVEDILDLQRTLTRDEFISLISTLDVVDCLSGSTAQLAGRLAMVMTAAACGIIFLEFVKKYKPSIKEEKFPIFDRLVEYSIKFFNQVIKENKKYKKPNTDEKKALEALIKTLSDCNDNMLPEEIQTKIYSVGKENGYQDNLRDWFKLIYEVVFGDENGPRLGFFISFFGIQETRELISEKINNV